MRAGGELKCPAGMVLQSRGGTVHSDEPDYCIEVTEVDQQSTEPFLAEREKSDFKLKDRPQPEGNLKGPKKPAIYFTYEEARAYCQWKYPGGDLPTNRQWEKACGGKKYCTASGELRHTEARFANLDKGPVDVDSYAANPRGTKNMTGNVWERTRELNEDGWNIIRGSSWNDDVFGGLRADGRNDGDPDVRDLDVGFRCVAPL